MRRMRKKRRRWNRLSRFSVSEVGSGNVRRQRYVVKQLAGLM